MGSTNFFPIGIQASVTGAGDAEKLAAGMEKIAASLDKAGKGAESSKTSFDRFAEGVRNAIQNPLQAAGNAAEGFLKTLGPVGVLTAGAAAGMAVVSKQAFDLVRAYGEAAEETQNLALRTGMSVQQTMQFSAAAKLAHTDIGSLQAGMRILAQTFEAGNEAGEKGRKLLKSWGIEARDTQGNLRPMGDLITEIGAGIAKLPDIAAKQLALKTLFGRGGSELLPFFQDMPALLKRVGSTWDESLNKSLAETNEKIELAELKWERFKKSIAGRIAVVVDFVLPDSMDSAGRYVFGKGVQPNVPTRGQTIQGGPQWSAASAAWMMNQGYMSPGGDLASRVAAMSGPSTWDAYINSGNSVIALERRLAKEREALKEAELKQDVAAHQKAISAIKGLEEQLKLAKMAEGEPFFVFKEGSDKGSLYDSTGQIRYRGAPSLRGRQMRSPFLGSGLEGMYTGIGMANLPFVVSEEDINKANAGAGAASAEQAQAYLAGLKEVQDRREQASRAALEHQIRMVDLLSGPGGEIAAIEKIYQLRMRGAKTVEEQQQAEYQRTEQLLQLHKQQVDQYVSLVQGSFNALISGGGGMSSFLKSQGLGMANTVVGNLARQSYGAMSKIMPHATEGTFLGGLLAGTPFGADPLNAAGMTLNTAGMKLQVAAQRLMAVSATGGGGGLVSGLFGGGYQGNGIFSFSGDTLSGGTTNLPLGWSFPELNSMTGMGKGGGLFSAKNLGRVAGIAAGGFGVYSGIKMGGGRGALTAIGSAAGTAAMLDPEPISKGILTAVALGSGLATMLFGDPKAKYDKQQTEMLQRAAFTQPGGESFYSDIYGRSVDHDYRGGIRVYVTVPVQAMDSKSFIDNRSKIADAMKGAMNDGHPVADVIRNAVRPR